MIRTHEEMRAAAEASPYPARGCDPTRVAIVFLKAPPAADETEIDPAAHLPDEFVLDGREIHLHCPNGFGRTELTNAYLEKELGVIATTRNWRTVTKLLELADR